MLIIDERQLFRNILTLTFSSIFREKKETVMFKNDTNNRIPGRTQLLFLTKPRKVYLSAYRNCILTYFEGIVIYSITVNVFEIFTSSSHAI